MAKTPAAEVVVGDRAVRISSPDRVVYEATDHTPAVTKLMVAEYFATVGDPLLRLIGERPVALERWPDRSSGDVLDELIAELDARLARIVDETTTRHESFDQHEAPSRAGTAEPPRKGAFARLFGRRDRPH